MVSTSAQNVSSCHDGNNQCTAVVLDHYTSAFHWAENNFSAIWLRPQWTLVTNSVLSDVQNAGISIVTGGDYTHSSVIPGFWGVVRNTILIGHTQPNDPAHAFARDNGPFNNDSRKIDPTAKCEEPRGGYCLNKSQGVSFPLSNFSVGQRLFNIYDGPSYQDSNVFLDIEPTPCVAPDCIYAFGTPGLRKYTSGTNQGKCYMPNAAIAWKQPNGFIYPPAFHSTNLFFDNVGIRHYVIEPLFQAPAGVTGSLDFGQGGTYLTDTKRAGDEYCGSVSFTGFTGIDRQTILNDDDGSLTGLVNSVTADQPARLRLKQTISVNEDSFFDAPVKTAECKSNVGVDPDKACPKQGKLPATLSPSTAMTSPYDYVTTVIVPGCSLSGPRFGRCGDDQADEPKICAPPPAPARFPECCKTRGDFNSGNICIDRYSKMQGRGGTWSSECGNESCYGVPLYRQLLTGNDGKDGKPRTREWARWFAAECNVNSKTRQCRWPFMRMAGENFYQRNTLTVNHGTYFIDTGVPREVQYGDVTKKPTVPGEPFNDITPCDIDDKDRCKPRSVNVFKAGETYYVFFLYAKQSTEQTYQIYVGKGFDTGTVMGVQVNLNVVPVSLAKTFPTRPGWLKAVDVKADILTVNVDFKGASDLDPTAGNLCQPKTFCQAKGDSCVSALVNSGVNTDPLLTANPALEKEVNDVCGTWAFKDLDCPKDGCFGFSFKLPSGFTTDATIAGPTRHRPAPNMFPTTSASGQPDWTAKFERTKTAPDNAQGGACFYKDLPGSTDCEVVDPTVPTPRGAALGPRRRR